MWKANIIPIIADQIDTMRSARTGKLRTGDIAFFYGIPLALVIAATILQWRVRGIDDVLTALSLMAGLLFNLLILLFDTAVRIRDMSGELADHRRELVSQLQVNVIYALAVALSSAAALGILSLSGVATVKGPLAGVLVLLLSHFVLLLGLILKRVRAVFQNELPKRAS